MRIDVGLDAGGTSIDISHQSGDATGTLRLPGVNVRRDGVGESARRFAAAIRTASDAWTTDVGPSLTSIVAVIGASGAGDPATCRALESRIHQEMQGDPVGRLWVRLMSDAELALVAAHGDEEGAVVVIGTGSIALIRQGDGSILQRGGLGFLLGDEAGGYAIGRAAVRYFARCIDQGAIESSLCARLADALGAQTRDALIETVYDKAFPLAGLASVVLKAHADGDTNATDIVEQQLGELAITILDLNRASGSGNLNYCLSGGLTTHPRFVEAVQRIAIPSRWTRVEPRIASAAEAALQIARTRPEGA